MANGPNSNALVYGAHGPSGLNGVGKLMMTKSPSGPVLVMSGDTRTPGEKAGGWYRP